MKFYLNKKLIIFRINLWELWIWQNILKELEKQYNMEINKQIKQKK